MISQLAFYTEWEMDHHNHFDIGNGSVGRGEKILLCGQGEIWLRYTLIVIELIIILTTPHSLYTVFYFYFLHIPPPNTFNNLHIYFVSYLNKKQPIT